MNGRELTSWRKTIQLTLKKLAELTGYTPRGLLTIEAAKDKEISAKLLILIKALEKTASS